MLYVLQALTVQKLGSEVCKKIVSLRFRETISMLYYPTSTIPIEVSNPHPIITDSRSLFDIKDKTLALA